MGCGLKFLKTNHVNITVDGKTYNSLSDLGLAIGNTDYIGSPVQDESNLIWVPGRSGALDLVDSVFGEQYFSYRPIRIEFGGMDQTINWDARISMIRNLFEGKNVQLNFWTEGEWYWKGRVHIEDFAHTRQLGRFVFAIPYADPYKYRQKTVTVTSPTTVTLLNSRLAVYPTITTTAAIVITDGDISISLDAGTHKNTALRLTKPETELTITGVATVTFDYLEGSL